MKKFLLSLVAAAFLCIPVTAQIAPAQKMNQAPLGVLKKAPNSPALNNFKKQAINNAQQNLSIAKPIVRAEEEDELRPNTMLSYMIDGAEWNTLGMYPIGDISSYLSSGYSGIGFAQYFDSTMLQRYVGNSIAEIDFVTWMGNYSNGFVYIIDPNSGFVFTADLDEISACSETSTPINTVACDYTITGQETSGLYIGWAADFSYSSSDPYYSNYGLIALGLNDSTQVGQGSYLLFKTSDDELYIGGNIATGWTNSAGETLVMQSAIFVYTDGTNGIKNNDANLTSVGTVRGNINKGATASANVTVTNEGLTSLSSFDYTFESNGQELSGTYTFDTPLLFCNSERVNLDAPLSTEAGSHESTLTITKVNTVEDEFTDNNDNVSTHKILTMDGGYKRIPVVEQFTSNYCGWCPRGGVAMNQMKESHGDDIVLIAVHGDMGDDSVDPLTDATYDDVLNEYNISSYPYSLINRTYAGDPYYAAPTAANEIASDICEASLTITADKIKSALTKTVNVKTDVTFNVPVADNEYGLAYIFTEDGVTGVNQLNYYAYYYYNYSASGYSDDAIYEYLGASEDTDMQDVCKQGTKSGSYYYYQPTYNYVSCSINSATGSESLIPATAAGATATINYEVSVPKRSALDINRDNLKMNVLLIDQTSGVIVTAKTVELTGEESSPSAIDNATADNNATISLSDGAFNVKATHAKAEVYTLDGKLVSSCMVNGEASIPTFGKGTFIIRVQEGSNVTTQKAVF